MKLPRMYSVSLRAQGSQVDQFGRLAPFSFVTINVQGQETMYLRIYDSNVISNTHFVLLNIGVG